MTYEKEIVLKDGAPCVIRTAGKEDAREVLDVYIRTHAETDYMLTYPEEMSFTEEQEAEYLENKKQSERETYLCAVVNGKIVGTAGIDALGKHEKTKHRCSFGIGIQRDYWGRGIGRALTGGCIECAKQAGFVQMELEVVAENKAAISLYEREGFTEYGRNPKGFKAQGGYQELVLMRRGL